MIGKQHKHHPYYVKGFDGNPYHDSETYFIIFIKQFRQ
jgi:hypothetical protein